MLSQTLFKFLSMIQADARTVLVHVPKANPVQKKIPTRKKKGHADRACWYLYSPCGPEQAQWCVDRIVCLVSLGVVARAQKRAYLAPCPMLSGLPKGVDAYKISVKGCRALAESSSGQW